MAYPSNSDSAITRKSLATEWEREDAIIESANGSKRDAANRYRAQLTKAGWPKEDVKAELEAFRKAFARARQITKHGVDAVEEADARVEEILVEIRGSNAPRVTRVEIIEEFPADDVPAHDEDGVILEPDSNSPEIPDSSTEPASHVAAAVGSDPADEAEEATGQADSSAPLNPGGENANSVGNADASHSPDDAAVEKRPSREPHKLETAGSSPAPATISETPGAGAPAAGEAVHTRTSPAVPGSIRTERTPPEGVEWHEVLTCFPEKQGKAWADFLDDVRTNGVREPIIRSGKFILDGRARYLAARELQIEYPVQEYAGDEPVADIIIWNLEARQPNLVERQAIAKKFAKILPVYADRVIEMFDLDQQREAAQ